MAGQTSYQDQRNAFPGQRHGMGHRARSMVNDTGAARQVDDVNVTGLAAAPYQFEVDLGTGAVPVTADFTAGAPASLTAARDALIASARADETFENRVAFNPSGAASVRITALVQGQGFTTSEADANLTVTNVQANAATQSVPFGRAVVYRTGAGTTERSAALPSATGQTLVGVVERIHTDVDPTNATPANLQGEVSPFQDMTVVYEGPIWVEVDEAVTEADTPHFRHTAGGTGGGAVGTWRTDPDTARADPVTGAKFITRTAGPGRALLSLNLA